MPCLHALYVWYCTCGWCSASQGVLHREGVLHFAWVLTAGASTACDAWTAVACPDPERPVGHCWLVLKWFLTSAALVSGACLRIACLLLLLACSVSAVCDSGLMCVPPSCVRLQARLRWPSLVWSGIYPRGYQECRPVMLLPSTVVA